MADISFFRKELEQRRGRKEYIEAEIEDIKSRIKDLKRSQKHHEEASEVIRQVALKTQQQLQYNISDITSMALNAVFPDPYELVAEFIQRRNKTECDLYFTRNGERADPLTASGGGAVDVASFALRVASWSMQTPKYRNTLFLDEPFQYLSSDLLPQASEMLKEISKKLGLQIIMVSHSEGLIEDADLVFSVSKKGKISQVNRR